MTNCHDRLLKIGNSEWLSQLLFEAEGHKAFLNLWMPQFHIKSPEGRHGDHEVQSLRQDMLKPALPVNGPVTLYISAPTPHTPH